MHLLSVEVRHWRGLEHGHLEDLSEGLNLVVGPNEAGKSRLFQALRFGLWESHKGEAAYKKALAGWWSAEPPWVAVELLKDGARYRVEKQFLKGAYARLAGGGETLKDEAAEEALRELLEVGGGGRQTDELSPADRGLWRLLWISQGESRRGPSEDLNEEPKAALQDLLSEEVGEVAAGPAGQRLLERVRQETGRYWTATGKPKSGGDLAKLQGEVADLRGVRDEAAAARESLVQEIRELDDCRRALEALGPRLAEREARRKESEERARAAREAAAALETHAARRDGLELRLSKAQGDLETHRELLRGERTARQEVTRLAQRLEALEAALASKQEDLAAAQRAAEAAEAAREKTEAAVREARSHAELRRVRSERETLEARLREAEDLRKRWEGLQRTIAGIRVDGPALERLERLEREWAQTQARLEGASAGIAVRALAPLTLLEGGPGAAGSASSSTELSAGEHFEKRLSEPATFTIEGVATLEILPGGEQLSGLRDAARDRRAALDRALGETGAESVAAARGMGEERARAEREAATQRAVLERCAPEGLEALTGELEAFDLRLATLAEQAGLEGLPAAGEPLEVAEAEAALAAAEGELRRARGAREVLSAALQEATTERALLRQELQGLRDRAELLARRVTEGPAETELEGALETLQRQAGEASLEGKALRQRFDEAGGEGASADLEQAQRALEGLTREREDLRRRAQTLEGRIAAREGSGLYETLQDRERELEEAEGRLERVRVRAEAARKLLGALEGQRQAAQQRLAAPVRRRIEPYLGALFPGSGLALDEDWQVRGLATSEVEEGFDALSAGAQEQLSLLVRLGLAEIFAADERLPLILDDALVHTDRRRRETMLQVLGRAARKLQILLFTCHDEAYDGLGAHRVYRLPGRRNA